MNVLDLFSGIGGFSLGLERAGMETIAFCEIEDYPRKVLNKHWPEVPIASDVTKLTYKDGVLYDDGQEIYRGTIDVVCGGFPCQDLSAAGRQEGISASRSGLFYEMCRVISECRPGYAIFENVTNLLNGGGGDWFTEVLCEISSLGYDAEWHCIPASYIGACHRRDRIWIIANPREINIESSLLKPLFGQSDLQRKLTRSFEIIRERPDITESMLCRKNDGVSTRVDRSRLAALGNAVVPQIPEIIGKAIMEIENDTGKIL